MSAIRMLPLWTLVLLPAVGLAQSPFDGTWRPDPQKPEPGAPPDAFSLAGGIYECQSCKPPYKVKADGADHPVAGNPRFDTLSVTVVDDRTLRKVAKKGAVKVVESTVTIAADGATLSERQSLYAMGPKPIDLTIKKTRVTASPPGTHRISGKWQETEADLTNHDEDTTLKVSGDTLSMSDRMGRSFAAKLDGTDAPYKGSPEFTSVSVKMTDPRTIEESDKQAGKVVKITRWAIDADGRTIHARFDDTHGFIQEQTGHKLP